MNEDSYIPDNVVTRSDGTTVACPHDGAPCNGCRIPEKDWPEIWRLGFVTLVEEEEMTE
ncbi:hypothetical protein ACFWMJ_23585 [Streptomyces hawaiiensis]|uniref:hypothetical protein n=1 Tax=Streptomyces hawaiiensis TaxID=67305 RepID=UPI00365CC816